jgi:hypothetical protein
MRIENVFERRRWILILTFMGGKIAILVDIEICVKQEDWL